MRKNAPPPKCYCIEIWHRSQHNPTQPKEAVNVNQTVTEKLCYYALLQGPKGVVTTSALLDDASSILMVDTDLAEQLGTDGPISDLCCLWTKRIEQIEKGSKKVKLEIGNTIGGKLCNLENGPSRIWNYRLYL
jgi:hypothetical protein